MTTSSTVQRPQPSQSLLRFRKASQAVHATQALDEVIARVIDELYLALDAEAASVALIDEGNNEIVLHAAGPVAEKISGLRLPPERGIIGWVIASGQSAIVHDVSVDSRFWPDVDGYSGFETQSVLCAPILTGQQVIGALEVLNKRHRSFTVEDLNFLEAFGAVAASAIESAHRFQQEEQRRRAAEALRRTWEILTVPRSMEALLDVILEQLQLLIRYRSASILLVTDDEELELGASRGIECPDEAAQFVSKLGLDAKVLTMLETRRPMLIADTRSDSRWQHFPGLSYIRSWMGAPLLIKGQLIGTLNVDHDQPGHFNDDHIQLLTDFAHQAAIAIENSRLNAATHEATLQLAEQARRMVALYEASRSLLSGLELDLNALRQLLHRVTELVDASYGFLNIRTGDAQPLLFIAVGPSDKEAAEFDRSILQRSILDMLSCRNDVIRSGRVMRTIGLEEALPSNILDSFLGVAIHARGRLLGQLLLADKKGRRDFGPDDEALAFVLATNLAGAVDNAFLYRDAQQRLRELTALYEVSHILTALQETTDVYAHLARQVARLLDAERCALFIYKDGLLTCQAAGYGIPPDIIAQLRFKIAEDDPVCAFIRAQDPLISNEVSQDPDLEEYRHLLAQLQIRRLLSCRIPIDEQQVGILLAADKRDGEEFSEQDRHLVSIIAHQVSSVLQRALLQNHQREQAQIQSALLQVAQAISSLTDLDELLQTIAQITHQLVGCDHCIIAPWQQKVAAFVSRAQCCIDPAMGESLLQIQLKPTELPYIDLATESREPLLLARAEMREPIPPWAQELLGLEHSLFVPLVTQERVVGLIIAGFSQNNHPPGEREITLVNGIARQAAIAIENANLYQDLQLHSARLERTYQDLKDVDERKTQFVQNVSHELRTPFTIIKGYLELLLEEEVGALSARQKEGLSIIAEKTEALGRLILDIVTVQSIDAASLELSQVDVRFLLQTALSSFQVKAPNHQLHSDIARDIPSMRADPSMLERAIMLLLENAAKFSPEGSVIILRASSQGDTLRVEIEDQGIGIPEEALPYIFDRFYQVDGSTTRRFGGAGLGLSIVKQIVTAHGGMVGLHSIEGQGSTFFFTLPLTSPPDEMGT